MAPTLKEAVAALIEEGMPEHYFTSDGGIMTETQVIRPTVHTEIAAAFVLGGV